MRPTRLLSLAAALLLTACEAAEPQAESMPAGALNTEATPGAPTPPVPTPESLGDGIHFATTDLDPASPMSDPTSPAADSTSPATPETATSELATLGAGCFWCVEAVLEQQPGVLDVTSGYMGGEVDNPTYRQVCEGTTGHAEVVQVRFDPTAMSYADLIDLFWRLHDPTTLNRQGADVGTQYRSAIFYHSDEQREIAEASKRDAAGAFSDPIVTEITPAVTYYEAEKYHQDYYRQNSSQGYCRAVIAPKLEKLGLQK